MQAKLSNYSKQDVTQFLSNFKSLIEKGCFEVIKTNKNEITRRRFRLNKTKIKEILLTLNEEDFKYKLLDNSYGKYGPNPLQVYKKKIQLLNFNGEEEMISLYIKIKEGRENYVPIISFHEDDKREEEAE